MTHTTIEVLGKLGQPMFVIAGSDRDYLEKLLAKIVKDHKPTIGGIWREVEQEAKGKILRKYQRISV